MLNYGIAAYIYTTYHSSSLLSLTGARFHWQLQSSDSSHRRVTLKFTLTLLIAHIISLLVTMAHYNEGLRPACRSLVVGLDIGTHGSGFSYSTDGGRTVRQHSAYPDQPAGSTYPKTLTALLYRGRQVVSVK